MLTAPVLHGRHVRLEPLSLDHLPGLIAVGCDPALWQITVNDGSTPEAMRRWVEAALEDQRLGRAVPFATVLQETGQVVGGSRFGNISEPDRRAEIGWTWVARAWQRTAVNTEAKFLMLRHAFEVWRLVRVEFKTDAINRQSRAALLGIGAREEGILRKHALTWTGRFRDSVFFSILDEEWPAVRDRLAARLAG